MKKTKVPVAPPQSVKLDYQPQDIRLPYEVPEINELATIEGQYDDLSIRWERNPWTIRAVCLAHLQKALSSVG